MAESEWLAERFEENREHLRKVAYRMLGSMSEAEDAVQEGWLRLSRADTSDVANLSGWLTTVVARVCLDQLRTRESRREDALELHAPSEMSSAESTIDPQRELELADSMSVALLVVLQTLAPAERVAFVLHDMFDLPFDEIAPIVGRSATAARQLASRARRRVRGVDPDSVVREHHTQQREVVIAFLAASRDGEFEALLALLDPDVVTRADAAAVALGASAEMRGASAVAKAFAGRAKAAREALIDGLPGAVWAPDGVPKVVFGFTFAEGRIVAIELIAGAERIGGMEVELASD
ncbi:MAG TPA: sigma-70 family RNA polymerase sigma factor [Gemmatimonadaceae bacterium]|nr:sigma-70 family RNA polymerase sigma factor [Gemmatimonadaceae bacterium]